MLSQKNKVFILIILIAGIAVFLFKNDLTELYSGLNRNLPQIEQGINGLIQETGKQVLTPPPLRAEKEAEVAVLTKIGVISWTNIQRAKFGLPALKESVNLDASVAVKVKDMFENQYFAHDSPAGDGVADLAEEAGYSFIMIGENLALGNFENDETLVQAWMDSPGHRANILNANYQDIGVFVQKGMYEGRTTWLAVQHFGKPLSACPQPSESLKVQIEQNKAQITQLQTALEALQREIQAMSRRDRELYNQKVEQYNALVSQYNNLISQTKILVDSYNSGVQAFNACAAGT